MKSPIFIFSLPRAGSTLLQRILMTNPQISSFAEPWILLPLIYSQKYDGIVTDYSQILASNGINDFLSNKKLSIDYNKEINKFVSNLYSKYCLNNELYFLDKTPRYYLIINEIVSVFPEAKFIFLFRNPIHVYSSILNTWSDNGFSNLHHYYNDLYFGPSCLTKGFKKYSDISIGIKYEDLVSNPFEVVKNICDYLEIDYFDEMLINFNKEDTIGRMGDPTGIKNYKLISSDSLDKWKYSVTSYFRKRIFINYLNKLPKDFWAVQNYNKDYILGEIHNINVSYKFSLIDLILYCKFFLISKFNLNLFFGSLTKSRISKRFIS